MLTIQAVHLFLSSREAKNDAEATVDWYRTILSVFEVMCPEVPDEPEEIDRFLASCPGGDERRHGYYRALRAFYRFLERRYDLANPVKKVDPPRRSRKLPKALEINALVKLLGYPHSPRIHAYLEFLADTGARIGELHSLQPQDIRETPWGFIARLDGKTGERYAPLLDSTYQHIINHIPVPYSVDYLGDLFRKAFDDAGVKGSAHCLRHTFGTLWEGSEFALQDIMGHSNFEMLKNYRRLRTKKLSELHKQYSPLLYLRNGAKAEANMV